MEKSGTATKLAAQITQYIESGREQIQTEAKRLYNNGSITGDDYLFIIDASNDYSIEKNSEVKANLIDKKAMKISQDVIDRKDRAGALISKAKKQSLTPRQDELLSGGIRKEEIHETKIQKAKTEERIAETKILLNLEKLKEEKLTPEKKVRLKKDLSEAKANASLLMRNEFTMEAGKTMLAEIEELEREIFKKDSSTTLTSSDKALVDSFNNTSKEYQQRALNDPDFKEDLERLKEQLKYK
jgi:hypothetical protein